MKEQEIEQQDILDEIVSSEYKYGFVSDIDQEIAPKGLNEDSIRLISSKKKMLLFLIYELSKFNIIKSFICNSTSKLISLKTMKLCYTIKRSS